MQPISAQISLELGNKGVEIILEFILFPPGSQSFLLCFLKFWCVPQSVLNSPQHFFPYFYPRNLYN
jgi:hypothetical protein